MSQVRVARARDLTLGFSTAAGIFRRARAPCTAIGARWACGSAGRCSTSVTMVTAVSLATPRIACSALHHSSLLGRRRCDRTIDREVEPPQPLTLVNYFGDAVAEGDLLGLEVEFDRPRTPPPPRMRPRAAVLWMPTAISKQVLRQTMFRPTLVPLRRRARAPGPAALVRGARVGNPHRRQRPALVAQRQLPLRPAGLS